MHHAIFSRTFSVVSLVVLAVVAIAPGRLSAADTEGDRRVEPLRSSHNDEQATQKVGEKAGRAISKALGRTNAVSVGPGCMPPEPVWGGLYYLLKQVKHFQPYLVRYEKLLPWRGKRGYPPPTLLLWTIGMLPPAAPVAIATGAMGGATEVALATLLSEANRLPTRVSR